MICRWGNIVCIQPLPLRIRNAVPHTVGPWNNSGLDAWFRAVFGQFRAAPYSSPGAVAHMAGRRIFTNRSRHGSFEGRYRLALAAAHLDSDRIFRRAILINVEN